MLTQASKSAPFCADPQRDAWLRALVEQSILFLLDQVGEQNIAAVILTGSAARGEASVLPIATGYRLLGDLDFLVIVKAPYDWPAVRRRMNELSRQATREVGADGQSSSIEYGPAGLVYLERKAQPSIFAYDLHTYGRVIWKQADVIPKMCSFSVSEIPRQDALNLLMNRLVEMLLLDVATPQAGFGSTLDRTYHLIKVVLDFAGSALAFAGRYVSRYGERSQAFRSLLDADPDLRSALPASERFLAALQRAVDCKLRPTAARLTLPDVAATVRQHVAWGHQLWLWEARRFLGLDLTPFPRTLEAYIARETFPTRLRGWIKFLHHPLRPACVLSWPHVLRHFFRTSPQTLTYAAALLTHAGIAGEAGPAWRQRLAALSPIPLSAANDEQVAREIGALWQWLVRNN